MGLAEELGLDKPIETIEHESLLNIIYTGTMIQRAAFRYFQGHKLTDAQFNVLVQLKYAKDGTLPQSALARRLVVNKADMTGIIDRLEKTGLVARRPHPNDRRVNMVLITDDGQKAVTDLESGYFDGVRAAMAGISRKDLSNMMRVLEIIRKNVAQIISSGRSVQ